MFRLGIAAVLLLDPSLANAEYKSLKNTFGKFDVSPVKEVLKLSGPIGRPISVLNIQKLSSHANESRLAIFKNDGTIDVVRAHGATASTFAPFVSRPAYVAQSLPA